jgi:hypothetical protein
MLRFSMNKFLGRLRACLLCAGFAAIGAGAFTPDTISFSTPAYNIGQRLVNGQNDWITSLDQSGDPAAFTITTSAPASQGQLLTVQMRDSAGTVYRYFADPDVQTVEVRWKWRPLDSLVTACVGVAGDSGSTRQSLEGAACFAPHGAIQGSGKVPFSSLETWQAGRWYYMRMRLDWAAKKFNVYMAADSLRGDEKAVALGKTMAEPAGDKMKRLAILTEAGQGSILIDDIAWEPYYQWAATAAPAAWSSGGNWSRGSPPDGAAPVVFNGASALPCNLDTSVSLNTVFFDTAYAGIFRLATHTLSVTGTRADFSGLRHWTSQAAGHLDFRSTKTQSLTGPADTIIPAVYHTNTGTLRLDGRKLQAELLQQFTGTLDFNGFDLSVQKDLQIRGPQSSLAGLGGRTLQAGRAAHLEGLSSAVHLGLNPATAWSITAGDSLVAKWADLGKCAGHGRFPAGHGVAWASADSNGNTNWIFEGPAVISKQPANQSTLVGKSATFSVSFGPLLNPSYQWYHNVDSIPGAIDSEYALPKPARADNGARFHCVVRNSVSSATSGEAALTVNFPAPTVDPDTMAFSDSLVVRLGKPVPGALLFYVADGHGPQAVPGDSVVIRASGTYKVYATLAGDVSDTAQAVYTKVALPSAPTPEILAADTAFDDSLAVTFKAPSLGVLIRYTTDGSKPTAALVPWNGSPFLLKSTATVKAYAAQAAHSDSKVASQTFTRRDDGPLANPPGGNFPDTVRIVLTARAASGSPPVRYTFDGSDPTAASPLFGAFIRLDSTATLKAASFASGQPRSKITSYQFSLVPDLPVPSYAGGQYPGAIDVILTSSTPKARIYYTLDSTEPAPGGAGEAINSGGSVRLNRDAVLKAVAVTGTGAAQRQSGVLTQNYTIVPPDSQDQTLAPGKQISLGGNYFLENPANGAPAQVKPLPADSFKTVEGFTIPLGVRISPASGVDLVLTQPIGAGNGLYRLDSAGAPRFVSLADQTTLKEGGVYFVGKDTVAPSVALSDEAFAGDSTVLTFSFKDNMPDLWIDVARSDNPSLGFTGRAWTAGKQLIVALKNPPGLLGPLTVALKVSDGMLAASFPRDAGFRYEAMQKVSGVSSPPMRIGADAGEPWDLVGFPFQASPPLTLQALRAGSGKADLAGMAWDRSIGDYRKVEGGEELQAGGALWLGLSGSLPSLTLPSLETKPRSGEGNVSIALHKGFNQISNPTLQMLHWPVSWKNENAVRFSAYKGLHGYDVDFGTWIDSDSLVPWKGYFVFSTADTSVELLRAPAAAKLAAPAPGLFLALRLGRSADLRLGAAAGASEGLGVEDEPQLPAPGKTGADLWSLRAGRRLGTDLVAWNPAGLMRWRVAARLPEIQGNGGVNRTGVTPGIRVEELRAEPGTEVWAVSRARGLKFPVAAGGTLPLQPGMADSLDLYAGPAAEVRSALARVPASVDAFRIDVAAAPGGFALSLSVKEPIRLRWDLRNLEGRASASGAVFLPEGIYRIPVIGSPGRAPAGLNVLLAEWYSASGSGRLARKLILP